MEKRIVLDMKETENNRRNSEGCFLRAPNGDILHAYSRYNSCLKDDHDPCDIAIIRSSDEGESWSEPKIVVKADFFGVKNIMSVSQLPLKDGRMCLYFLVIEADGSTTIGRAISEDGETFQPERCNCKVPTAFYVIANDRFLRLADGRIATVASKHDLRPGYNLEPGTVVALVSDDDGEEFYRPGAWGCLPFNGLNDEHGLEEPIMVELSEDLIWVLARTAYSYQYQAFSVNELKTFTPMEPSAFSSQLSPITIKRLKDRSLIAVYNPLPNFDSRQEVLGDMLANEWWSGRTPLVLRRSSDNGRTWGRPHILENAKNEDFAYPALFETNDGGLLCAYWCKKQEEYSFSMRIAKIDGISE